MLRGSAGEALVCTDSRVIILKGGFFAGQFFGNNTYQLPYANIAGAEVRTHLLTGYFQLNAGGMNSTDMSYWNMRLGPAGNDESIRHVRPTPYRLTAANSTAFGKPPHLSLGALARLTAASTIFAASSGNADGGNLSYRRRGTEGEILTASSGGTMGHQRRLHQ